MGLSESKKKQLEDKKFDELYSSDEAVWRDMAKRASQYAKMNITDGNIPRPDDVAKILYPMIEVNEAFRSHQEDNCARAKRFVEMFTEYVIDRVLVKKEGSTE